MDSNDDDCFFMKTIISRDPTSNAPRQIMPPGHLLVIHSYGTLDSTYWHVLCQQLNRTPAISCTRPQRATKWAMLLPCIWFLPKRLPIMTRLCQHLTFFPQNTPPTEAKRWNLQKVARFFNRTPCFTSLSWLSHEYIFLMVPSSVRDSSAV